MPHQGATGQVASVVASTFALETRILPEQHRYVQRVLYIAGPVWDCIAFQNVAESPGPLNA